LLEISTVVAITGHRRVNKKQNSNAGSPMSSYT